MQLDKTHVVIRPRSFSEIGDLTLILIRRYPRAITIGFLVGALPWAIFNAILLSWIPLGESTEEIFEEEAVGQRFRYIWLMACLVFLQTPLAGMLTTTYIGQAVFETRPTWKSVIRDTLRISSSLVVALGIFRCAIPASILVALVFGQPFSPLLEMLGLISLVGYAYVVRSVRPFLPEILLLERCPMTKKDPKTLTAGKRSGLLHSPISGDMLGRMIAVSVVSAVLTLAIFYSLVFVAETILMVRQWSLLVTLVFIPFTLWTVAAFNTVLRFVSYMDSRIRLEGWEVELLLRAEYFRIHNRELTPQPLSTVQEELA